MATANLQFSCHQCGKKYSTPADFAGKGVRCGCGAKITVPSPTESPLDGTQQAFVSQPRTSSVDPQAIPIKQLDGIATLLSQIAARLNTETATTLVAQMQYKVLTQKDKWFSGKFDPEKLEGAINSYASQGWRVCGVATASFPGFGGKRDEMVIVMEREA